MSTDPIGDEHRLDDEVDRLTGIELQKERGREIMGGRTESFPDVITRLLGKDSSGYMMHAVTDAMVHLACGIETPGAVMLGRLWGVKRFAKNW